MHDWEWEGGSCFWPDYGGRGEEQSVMVMNGNCAEHGVSHSDDAETWHR